MNNQQLIEKLVEILKTENIYISGDENSRWRYIHWYNNNIEIKIEVNTQPD